jgi:PAS domain S-box-containing protein
MDLRKRAEQIVSKDDRPISSDKISLSFDETRSAAREAEKVCALFAQRLRELLENSQGAAYKRNLNSDRYEYLSPVFAQLTGYTPDEMETMQIQKVLDLIHSDDAREVARVIDEAMSTSTGTPFTVEYRFKHKGGWEVWLRDRFVVMADLEGRPVALVGDTSDITERKRMERSLRDSEDKYRTVFSISNDAIFVIDQETLSILDANQAACDLYGYTHVEMLLLKATDMSAEQEKTTEAARRMQADSAAIPLRLHKTKGGLVFPVEISACFFLFNDRMTILTSIRDISKRRLVEEEIPRLSYRDGMTGLYNRRFYEEELRRLETPRNLPLSFVIADVNGLKLINDSYGHVEGDELL